MKKYTNKSNTVTDGEISRMMEELKPFIRKTLAQHSGLPFEEKAELKDVILNAVWEALRDYNPENAKGASRKTWCASCITWAVSQYLSSNANAVTISKDDYAMRRQISEEFEKDSLATPADVAERLGVTERTVLTHMTNISRVPMSKPVGNPDDDLCLEDVLADEGDTEDDFQFREYLPLLEGVMEKCLTVRERDILKSLFGIGGRKLTSVELGKIYGISHQMISKIRESALKKLRCSLAGASLVSEERHSISVM